MPHRESIAVGREASLPADTVELRDVFVVSYRRLVVQLYGVTGDFGEAEDVVQEAFVRASAAGNRFLRVDNHEAWLRTAAINLHRQRLRKLRNFAKVRPRLLAAADPPGLDEHAVVIEALRKLPEGMRQVLAMHYLADLHIAEIAEHLGVAEGTVKSRLNRGRDALAALLAEEPDRDR
jgi:RNA polymerase sigma-70 factor (ECF subfamily)